MNVGLQKMGTMGRLESITIMRGLAAFSVMLFHLGSSGVLVSRSPELDGMFHYGFVGVPCFFVISGFVIPFSMHQTNYSIRDALPFFVRRLVRLEPCYLVTVAGTFAMLKIAEKAPSFNGQHTAFDPVMLASQVGYVAPWIGQPWLVIPAWTLAIEFQYYVLMLFLGHMLFSKRRALLAIPLVIAATTFLVFPDQRAVFKYLPCFAVGFSAFLLHQGRVGRISFGALVSGFSLITAAALDPASGLAALASSVAIFAPIKRRVALLSSLGAISYSLYLVHATVGGRIVSVCCRFTDLPGPLILVFAVVGSIVAASVLWYFIEKPTANYARAIRSGKSRHTLRLRSIGVMGHGPPRYFETRADEKPSI